MELRAQDEYRLGLKAGDEEGVGARGREARGRAPPPLRVDLPLCPFVRPTTGEVHRLILPVVNAETFSMALSRFAGQVGAGKDKRIGLMHDRAGWHTSPRVEVPEGIELEFSCPRSSPEPRPYERPWPLTDEGVADTAIRGHLGSLEEALIERCVALCGPRRSAPTRATTGGRRQPENATLLNRKRYHAVAVYFCQQAGLSPLRFSELLID